MSILKFRPSNATMGDSFINNWCASCARDKVVNGQVDLDAAGETDYCQILLDTHMFEVDEPGYPEQWQYGPDGYPRCTAFIPVEAGEIRPTAQELEAAGQLPLDLPIVWPERIAP